MAARTLHRVILGDARNMADVPDSSVHLVVTSPPYWQLKDYGAEGQIGYDQGFEEYIRDLDQVWVECSRVLHAGCRAGVNVGDQFARAETYGRYQVLPIHAEVIAGMRRAGLDYMGSIIWRKVTTCNTTGGGVVMGSYPYPRNGIVKIDYEYILLFRKPGEAPRPDPTEKEASRLDPGEWGQYFSGHWSIPGARARRHLAPFPHELPRRLIRMFTFPGETVLDPFLGSGVTAAVACEQGRNSIGFEINPRCCEAIRAQPQLQPSLLDEFDLVFEGTGLGRESSAHSDSAPVAPAAGPLSTGTPSAGTLSAGTISAGTLSTGTLSTGTLSAGPAPDSALYGSVVRDGDRRGRYERTYRVTSVDGPNLLRLSDGAVVYLAGTRSTGQPEVDRAAVAYLGGLVRRSRVVVEESEVTAHHDARPAFVRLINRTFLNGKLIRHGLARFDESSSGRFLSRLRRYEEDAREERAGVWKHGGLGVPEAAGGSDLNAGTSTAESPATSAAAVGVRTSELL